MENASKALIIAGAILLSILIITLGLTVYNQAKNSMGSSNLDAQEIRAHNSQFLSYEGKQKGSEIRSLVTAIRQNNRDYTDRMINIDWKNAIVDEKVNVDDIPCADPTTSDDPNDTYTLEGLNNNTTYFVTFAYSDNGCIGGVNIHIWSEVD